MADETNSTPLYDAAVRAIERAEQSLLTDIDALAAQDLSAALKVCVLIANDFALQRAMEGIRLRAMRRGSRLAREVIFGERA